MNKSNNKFQQTLIIFLAATVGFLIALLLGDHSELLRILVNTDIVDLVWQGLFICLLAVPITCCLALIYIIGALIFNLPTLKKQISATENETAQSSMTGDDFFNDKKPYKATKDDT
jgi:hypothetical protein